MPNLLRYVFGFMGILSLGALVVLDKIYTGGQPVPERVYIGFILVDHSYWFNYTKIETSKPIYTL